MAVPRRRRRVMPALLDDAGHPAPVTGASLSSSSTTRAKYRQTLAVVDARSGCDRNASIAAARSTSDATARRSAGRLRAVVTSAVLQWHNVAHQALRRATSQETCRLRARPAWRAGAPGARAAWGCPAVGWASSRGMGPSPRTCDAPPTGGRVARLILVDGCSFSSAGAANRLAWQRARSAARCLYVSS